MNLKTKEHYEVRAQVAKALAHPARLLMLDAIQQCGDGEMCVCDLTEIVGVDQSTVSRHLAVLKQAGVLADRKEGVMTFFRLRVRCLEGFWGCVEIVLKEKLKAQQKAVGR